MKYLVLSLFPGIDLFGHAFHKEGFCVVHGPEIEFGWDIRDWSPIVNRFDVVIGGPPCQMFSPALHGHDNSRHGNLIPEYVRAVAVARPKVFVHENVEKAPVPIVPGYAYRATKVDAWEYGAKQHRNRMFTIGYLTKRETVTGWPFELEKPLPMKKRDPDPFPCVMASEHRFSKKDPEPRKAGRKVGRMLTMDEVKDLMGAPDWPMMPKMKVRSQYEFLGNGVEVNTGRMIARTVLKGLKAIA